MYDLRSHWSPHNMTFLFKNLNFLWYLTSLNSDNMKTIHIKMLKLAKITQGHFYVMEGSMYVCSFFTFRPSDLVYITYSYVLMDIFYPCLLY